MKKLSLTISSVGEDVRQPEQLNTPGRNQAVLTIWESNLEFSSMVEEIHTPGYIFWKNYRTFT